jgi:hypothetical protein
MVLPDLQGFRCTFQSTLCARLFSPGNHEHVLGSVSPLSNVGSDVAAPKTCVTPQAESFWRVADARQRERLEPQKILNRKGRKRPEGKFVLPWRPLRPLR